MTIQRWCNLARNILGREHELQQVVQLIGQDALSEMEREILLISRILREDFLQQSAIHDVDSFCPSGEVILDVESDPVLP